MLISLVPISIPTLALILLVIAMIFSLMMTGHFLLASPSRPYGRSLTPWLVLLSGLSSLYPWLDPDAGKLFGQTEHVRKGFI